MRGIKVLIIFVIILLVAGIPLALWADEMELEAKNKACRLMGYDEYKWMDRGEIYCIKDNGEAQRVLVDRGDFWDLEDVTLTPLKLYDYRSREASE